MFLPSQTQTFLRIATKLVYPALRIKGALQIRLKWGLKMYKYLLSDNSLRGDSYLGKFYLIFRISAILQRQKSNLMKNTFGVLAIRNDDIYIMVISNLVLP